ncbi:winged helix-turn-helix domain-containing protein [Pseudoalteromonas sp. SMS1]|uniref:winged helix-turn-helix domain-containing protein n=1 Tax=Pseudoalteromonas sp. SMS1 TaxID=2908894 RepID=UPI001F3F130A|nr:winged helix-turn-helix domain-containing protein [Pseudoalteromonas sp. SMS1]MCF2860147.1 winged helix-turn-helix domain-containing protein [Pseudoalteromonas sp. SMS1]
MSSPSRFYINEFLIDLSRSEVICNARSVKVEPKILQVLLLLAQHPQQVVSHQQIMAHVWSGTEVVPNALQRCIARLRKVLGDDAKSPHIIATHPKIGYRLIADVKWQQTSEEQPNSAPTITSRHKKGIYLLVLGLALILSVVWLHSSPKQRSVSSIKPITQTDANERDATYSPDGQYIVFNRHVRACQSHIWAKHLASGTETRLTAFAGFYQDTRFTPDGRNLIFAQQHHCDQPTVPSYEPQTANCWQINMLDLAESLQKPQSPSVRYQCQASAIERPIALPNHHYAFLHTNHGERSLVSYSATTHQVNELFMSAELTIYSYDFDHKHSKYIVLSRNDQLEHVLTVLNIRGEVMQQNTIHLQGKSQFAAPFHINLSSDNSSLVAVNQGRLYHLTLNGALTPYNLTSRDILSAYKHPTQPKLVAIRGYKDTDIAKLIINEQHHQTRQLGINQRVQPYKSIARTKAQEKSPRFQPLGELVAFISARTGHDEVWLWDGKQSTRISRFTTQTNIDRLVWSPSGEKIAAVVDGVLRILDLNGNIEVIHSPIPLKQVVAWHGQAGLFVTAKSRQTTNQLWRVNMKTLHFTSYPAKNVHNIWLANEHLYISDFSGKVFKQTLSPETKTSQHLPTLNGKSLVLHDALFYSYDPTSKHLSTYSLTGEIQTQIMPLKPFAWKITDVRDKKVLLEQVIELNHDVVEISF